MKISIESVEQILLEQKIDTSKVSVIVKELEQVAEEEKEERQANAEPKSKWEYVIVLHDKDGSFKDKEVAGWVVQQKEGQNASLVLSKLSDAAKSQNDSAKRKKSLIKDLVSLFEGLKSKFTKEKGVRVKTKELTRVIIADGKLV
jgi:hypothetical protein